MLCRFLFIKGIKQLLQFSCSGHGKSHFTSLLMLTELMFVTLVVDLLQRL